MTIAFILGNGQSRLAIDSLYRLKSLGKIYGCNALYRTFAPDVLVSVDAPISEEIQNSSYSLHHKHFTRKPIPLSGAQPVPIAWSSWSSGPLAAALACLDGWKNICLIGMDLESVRNHKLNNVYIDTPHYLKSADEPTPPDNWKLQFLELFEQYPKIQFTRVVDEQSGEFTGNIPNLENMNMPDFLALLNSKRDLL